MPISKKDRKQGAQEGRRCRYSRSRQAQRSPRQGPQAHLHLPKLPQGDCQHQQAPARGPRVNTRR
ncbi:uncharacterized protein FMAN_06155 [Fusarium mangiferae]|uniref:Uncharacterized protein n=1 Tax=Fusarium mangiferae TaxID=192010 RepID=A0A1L7STM2_FUSMA|nr:uncharacterized protein FMAN_06155 [Fusarium mangiferae]CVK86576.1 uncharacterized protein FMAN_06155 [Fusarium mangiferae]